MVAVQRRGDLRVRTSYRMVFQTAVLVITLLMPIDLLAREIEKVYDRRNVIVRRVAKK